MRTLHAALPLALLLLLSPLLAASAVPDAVVAAHRVHLTRATGSVDLHVEIRGYATTPTVEVGVIMIVDDGCWQSLLAVATGAQCPSIGETVQIMGPITVPAGGAFDTLVGPFTWPTLGAGPACEMPVLLYQIEAGDALWTYGMSDEPVCDAGDPP